MDKRHLAVALAVTLLAGAGYLLLSRWSPAPEEVDEASAGVAPAQGAVARPPAPITTGERGGEISGGVVAPIPAAPQPTAPAPRPGEKAPTSAPAAGGGAAAGAGSGVGTTGSGAGGSPEGESKASLNKEDIRAAINELKPQIKECFEQGLKANPNLDGTVKVEFVIVGSPDGGGAYAREGEINDSSLAAPLVEACILSKIQTAKFKAIQGNGEVRVKYPFRLSSGSGGGFGGE